MKKFWMVYTHKNDGKLECFDTKKEAEERAVWKASQSMDRDPVYVLEPVTVARRPLPQDITVTDLAEHAGSS
jgi:hypothetical protein